MKVRTRGVAVLLLSFVFMLSVSGLLMAAKPSIDIIKAAQRGLNVFSAGQFNLDFCSPEQWRTATLGEGFQIYTVKADQLLGIEEGLASTTSLKSNLSPTGMWCFFVNVNNKPVALIDVVHFEGQWTAVGIGSAGIAQELGRMKTVWHEQSDFTFVRVYEAKSDFLQVNQGYLPFASARVALQVTGDYDYMTPMSAAEILTPLKEIVAEQYQLMNEEN